MSVVVIGAYTRDLYMFGDRLPHPGETVNCYEYAEAHGGKAANQAVAAARRGAATALISALGNDVHGTSAFQLFQREGINTDYVLRSDIAPTGSGFIIVDAYGVQLISTYAGACSHLTVSDIDRAKPLLERASVLLVQGEISAEISHAAIQLIGPDTIVVLDPSPVETFIGIPWLDRVNILTPNHHEASILTAMDSPDASMIAARTGIPIIIITHGGDGAEVQEYGSHYWVPAPTTSVVDTTGAGDAFNGALAAGIDKGLDLKSAVEHACRCASFSVARRFCIPSYPTEEDLPWKIRPIE